MLALAFAQHQQHAGAEKEHEKTSHRPLEEQALPKPSDPIRIPFRGKFTSLSAANGAHDEDVHYENSADGDTADDIQHLHSLVSGKGADVLMRYSQDDILLSERWLTPMHLHPIDAANA